MLKHADEVPAEAGAAGTATTRQVLIGADEAPNIALRRFRMEPGGGMPLHTNTVEHEQYVLRGRARITVGGEVLHVHAGDALFIPAGVPHDYAVEGDEAFEFLCVVPNRPDKVEILGGGAAGADGRGGRG